MSYVSIEELKRYIHDPFSDRGCTEKERQAVKLTVEGLTQLEIAEKIGISVQAVRQRLAQAYKKIGAECKQHMIKLYHRGLQRILSGDQGETVADK